MRIIITILLYLLFLSSFSQYRFDHLGINDGLSQSSVNDIFQDSEGFMWFATQDGLDRFDGYEFEYFNKESEPSLAGNFLWNIVEDPYGNIWTASATGATRLDWRNGKSTKFYYDVSAKNPTSHNQVGCIVDLGDKMLIAFDGRESFIVEYDAFSDSTEILLYNEHLLYSENLNLNNSLYDIFMMGGKKVSIHYKHLMIDNDSIPLPSDSYTSIFKKCVYQIENGFLLGTQGGLVFVDLTSHEIRKTSVKEPINDIILSPESDLLWLATDQGIINYDPILDHSFETIDANNNSDLFSSLVMSIHQSMDGLYWIGTSNGGLNVYDPQKEQFKFLNKSHGLSGKPNWAIEKVGDQLFIGSDDGIYVAKLKNELTENQFASNAIEAVRRIDIPEVNNTRITGIKSLNKSKILIGSANGQIVVYDVKSEKFKSKSLVGSPILSSIQIRNDTIWITTHDGIYQLSMDLEMIDHFQESTHPEFNTNYFLSSFMTEDKTLWLGSNTGFTTISSKGEIKNIKYDEYNPKKSPNHYFITGFFEDKSGSIWMSTFGGGVSCFNRTNNDFFHITSKNGLINNTCSSIQGNHSHVFVSTNGGLSAINISSKKIQNFTKEDGLLSNEFAIGSSTSYGYEFFFGGVDGIIAFKGIDLDSASIPPPSKVNSIDINYNSMAYSSLSENGLEIFPSDKIFSFSFSDFSYRKRDQTTYEYKLEGFNSDWIAVNSSNRRATYSLSPNTYNFKVRTVLNEVKSVPTSLNITVHPAFYQTWWFITLSILGGISLIALISRYYSHQTLKEKLRKLEVQQKIQSERERISRDLHDNVGSQITYIASSIDNLSSNGEATEIKELGEFTRDTMRQLRETIWVINHDEVSIKELRTKVIDYLADVLKYNPEIKHQVSFPDLDISLNPTWAINVFRVIQEAVNNVVKHACAQNITVLFEYDDSCRILIKDDGIGFDGNDKMGHFGLINIRSRASDLGGRLEIQSSDLGTEIRIIDLEIGQIT